MGKKGIFWPIIIVVAVLSLAYLTDMLPDGDGIECFMHSIQMQLDGLRRERRGRLEVGGIGD